MNLIYKLVNLYPFYKKARDLWLETQMNQIIKGLEKYPEPFTPSHWTAAELLDHALQESVDLTHYIVGLKEVDEAKDAEIERLKEEIEGLRKQSTVEFDGLFDFDDKTGRWVKETPNTLKAMYDNKPPYADLDD